MPFFLRPSDLEYYRDSLKEDLRKAKDKPKLRVCCGTGCVSNGSLKILEAFRRLSVRL